MPKPSMRISSAQLPDLDELKQENERLREELRNLYDQIAATDAGIRAILDANANGVVEYRVHRK